MRFDAIFGHLIGGVVLDFLCMFVWCVSVFVVVGVAAVCVVVFVGVLL